MKQHFAMMAAYNAWANRRLYDAAAELSEEEYNRDVGAFFGSVCGTLNHILVGDRLWLKRFAGEDEAPPARVPFPAFAALKAAREAEDERIVAWVGGLADEALAGRFSYTTFTGAQTFSQRLAPALSSLFNHQTHHRGQVHTILTVLGKPSVPLDLIYFLRAEEGRAFA